MNFKDTIKYEKYVADHKIYCKCGHSIFTNKKEIICSWCNRKVVNEREILFKDTMKKMLDIKA